MKPNLNHRLICLSFLIFGFNAPAQENAVIGTYEKITSAILGGGVKYLVHLPEGYEKSGIAYPVLYMLNAQSVSNLANAVATLEHLESERIPDIILIGICNEGVAARVWACPDDSGKMISADRFNDFLEKELIPEIAKKYRVNDYRILMGQSNYGLFALNNLMHRRLFRAYGVASPMFGWCPGFQMKELNSFLESGKAKGLSMYMPYGELDYIEVLGHMDSCRRLLEKRSPPDFKWKAEKILNDGHVPYISLHHALIFFFAECTLTPELQDESVAAIRAHYETISKEFGFTVNPKGNILMNLAWDLKEQKKFDRSVEVYDYLCSIYPGNAIYLATYGITLFKKGDMKGAMEKAMAALALDPEQPHAKALMEKLEKTSALSR
jgi:predicted alpha/beta superfamily hydrolase